MGYPRLAVTDFAPFVRILLRIFAGYLIGRGVSEDTAMQFTSAEVLGAVMLVLNEVWYFLARRYGWAK